MSEITIKAWKCDREGCGHVWLSPSVPVACAKCKSRSWNKATGARPVVVVVANDPGREVFKARVREVIEKPSPFVAPTPKVTPAVLPKPETPPDHCAHRFGSVCEECAKARAQHCPLANRPE